MRAPAQQLNEILDSLRPLTVEWKDDTAKRVISEIEAMPCKQAYTVADVQTILDRHFDDGLLILRLFLGLSKDLFSAALRNELGTVASGIKAYTASPAGFIEALVRMGVLEAMGEQTNRIPKWSDVLVERLRSGRGSAISGQRRGREVENFAEAVVRRVFGDAFEVRCTFRGKNDRPAKCDFAIPSKADPRIVIESKGYGATGSKMTDVIGDIEKIIAAKRSDTALLFFTDGLTWKQRISDLRKIVAYQHTGDITRIYTYAMEGQFEADLRQLKQEHGL
jgi:DpnII restriction endonuclease